MRFRSITFATLAALGLLSAGARPAHSDEPRKGVAPEAAVTPQQGRKAVERGTKAIASDAPAVREKVYDQ